MTVNSICYHVTHIRQSQELQVNNSKACTKAGDFSQRTSFLAIFFPAYLGSSGMLWRMRKRFFVEGACSGARLLECHQEHEKTVFSEDQPKGTPSQKIALTY